MKERKGLSLHPIEVATNETVEFLLRHLSAKPLRLLEVGCGTGEVAARLQGYHHHVIAIDSEAKAIEQAKLLGVDARIAVWPFFEERAFDAILFTRSLHHISPLDAALSHASHLLLPGGVLLVEDFAYNEMDPPTSEWVYGLLVLLRACGMIVMKEESFSQASLEGGGDFALWQQQHDPHLHTAPMIAAALKQVFPQVAESAVPYLYRYLLPVLPETEQGYLLATHLLELEKRMASVGGVKLIGRRYVAHKR